MPTTDKVANRLINEKSPYLLQHAYNPVDWYAWNDEAFEKAKVEDKPIFLSIGYSTCHWCHVMERESFEDEEVAEVLNKYFVSIKVDREERPDVDSIYMTFCQAYTGSGGWPLTIIMTPDRHPFFAGTYFPKRGKFGMMGIIDILEHIEDLWQNEREKCTRISKEMLNEIKNYSTRDNDGIYEELDQSIVKDAVKSFKQHFQNNYGGFSRAPKFPTPHNLYFLLRYYHTNKDEEVLNMVEKTLQCMYKGGIFDHIGFGFSRYSTDEKWLVPHFEKMLYDNALLSLVYTEAYSLTGKELYRDVAEKIYTYILRDMTDAKGSFYSAEDADSEGVEGKFYLWSLEELQEILGKESSQIYAKTYDITQQGNFEGKNIPNLIQADLNMFKYNSTAQDKDMNGEETKVKIELETIREKLFNYREQRIHPFKDDKILTSWNGLMIASLSYAGKVYNNKKYIESAKAAADFILKSLIREDGRLLARYRDGEAANLGVLDDYSFIIWGLIELYEACLEVKYLKKALELNNQMIKLFMDEKDGGFYLYGNDSEELIIRPKDIYDGAIPSGNSVAALNLLRLAKLTGDQKFADIAERQLSTFGAEIKSNPLAYVNFISAFMYSRMSIKEVVLAGNKTDEFIVKALLKIDGVYNPYQVLILNDGNEEMYEINSFIKSQQKIDGKDSIYICENFSCSRPITDLNQLNVMH